MQNIVCTFFLRVLIVGHPPLLFMVISELFGYLYITYAISIVVSFYGTENWGSLAKVIVHVSGHDNSYMPRMCVV